MLLATPALEAPVFLSAASPESTMPKQLVLTEADLASRWAMSPKTLQRWRMTGNGPTYLKLGKRVSYPLNAVIAFENCVQHVSTSKRIPGKAGTA
jgi:hypothetical protein